MRQFSGLEQRDVSLEIGNGDIVSENEIHF